VQRGEQNSRDPVDNRPHEAIRSARKLPADSVGTAHPPGKHQCSKQLHAEQQQPATLSGQARGARRRGGAADKSGPAVVGELARGREKEQHVQRELGCHQAREHHGKAALS